MRDDKSISNNKMKSAKLRNRLLLRSASYEVQVAGYSSCLKRDTYFGKLGMAIDRIYFLWSVSVGFVELVRVSDISKVEDKVLVGFGKDGEIVGKKILQVLLLIKILKVGDNEVLGTVL